MHRSKQMINFVQIICRLLLTTYVEYMTVDENVKNCICKLRYFVEYVGVSD